MKHITNNPDSAQDLTAVQWYRKRRQNSPWFWVQLVGGSMVVHGIVLTIALPITARLSAAADGSPTPVEFVELSEPAPPVETTPPAEPALEQPAPTEPAPTEPIQSAPAPEPIPPSSIGFAPEPSPVSSPTPSPEATPQPSPEATPEPSPEVPAEVPAEIPTETAALPSPQPESLPLPVLPSATEPSPPQTEQVAVPSPEPPTPETPTPETPTPEAPLPEASPSPEVAPSPETPAPEQPPDRTALSESDTVPGALRDRQPEVPNPQPAPPETPEPGLQTTPINEPVPDVSGRIAAAPSTVDTDNLDAVNNQATAPTGVMLSLAGMSRIAPLAGAPVETLELARPIESSTTFLPDPSTSSCQVTPDVLNRAGTPIALRITTNDQGGVENVLVNQSSGSPEYDQLAVCLVQEQWRFQAATALNAGETQRQPIASDELQITITINRN